MLFRSERGLLITIRVSISANQQTEENNFFYIEISFRHRSERLFRPHRIKEAEIVFGYLWPNPYYRINENLIIHTLSEESSPSGTIMPVDPEFPELPELHEVQLPPSPIPEILELPGITEFNRRTEALHQRVEDHNRQIRELPLTPEARLDTILERIRSGVNLDKLAFSEGNLTYQQLRRIDQLTNPQFYSEVSLLEDADYQPPHVKEPEPLGEEQEVEEEQEQRPLQILVPSGTHSKILSSEPNAPDLSQERLRESLDIHLGMIIDKSFQFPESD